MRKPARKAGKAAQRLPHPSYYVKKNLEVTLTDLDGKHPRKITAMVYVMAEGHDKLELPAKDYYDILAKGYEHFGFNKYQLELALREAKEAMEDELS